MTMTQEQHCDILIVGASLAGNCLARQLQMQQPDLSIVVLERKSKVSAWVGESTIETFYDYCTQTLHLGHYLESNHLVKHGLRFFFDSPEKNLPLAEMSELGRRWYLPMPAFQLDREKFDQDLINMNREMGIDVQMGTRVKEIEIDREQGHRIHTSNGSYQCRWLIDAAGHASPLSRKLEHAKKPIPDHPVGSYWGRYEGCPNFDELGNEQWRQQVKYTSRYLSTNHFMYKGYWIWVIPLSDTVTSIGVCYHHDKAPLSLKNEGEMTAFFRKHKALDQIIGDARCLDFQGLKTLQRQADPVFSADRWFMTGISAGFLDAMFSTGCAYLSDTNRMIGKLIQADIDGDEAKFISRVKHYNIYAKVWFETVLNSVKGMYTGLYDIQVGFYIPTLFAYFGINLTDSMTQHKELTEAADAHSSGCDCNFESLKAEIFDRGTIPRLLSQSAEFFEFTEQHDPDIRNNRGKFYDSTPPPDILVNPLNAEQGRPKGDNQRIHRYGFDFGMRYFLKRMAEMDSLPINDDALDEVIEEANLDYDLTLNEAFDKLRESAKNTSPS